MYHCGFLVMTEQTSCRCVETTVKTNLVWFQRKLQKTKLVSCQMTIFHVWIWSRNGSIVSSYWLEWRSQSVLFVECLCVRGTLQEEKDRYSLPKPAVSLPYWCSCHHRLTDWLLDEHPFDWCDRQLAWCPNLTARTPPQPLSHSRAQGRQWVWAVWVVGFHYNSHGDWHQNF